MRVLHVACLPFPSFQGTQAAIASMLGASADAGMDAHLLTYGHGSDRRRWPFTVHRIDNIVEAHSLRSGPSVAKVMLDTQVARRARSLCRELRPDRVVAHHVEAAIALRVAGIRNFDFVAHTSLDEELPSYGGRSPRSLLRYPGAWIDRLSLASSGRALAVSPALADRLARRNGHDVGYVPVPWRVAKQTGVTRPEARHALGLPAGPTCLYAGNLDAYQAWEDVLRATAALVTQRPDAHCVVATESDPRPVRALAANLNILDAVSVCRLNGETMRRFAHSAADVVVVPRRTPGGVPIKLLDALARGNPVVATERALSGLPLGDACEIVCNDSPGALAGAIGRLCLDHKKRNRLAGRGRAYIRRHHAPEEFLKGLHSTGLSAPRLTMARARPERPTTPQTT